MIKNFTAIVGLVRDFLSIVDRRSFYLNIAVESRRFVVGLRQRVISHNILRMEDLQFHSLRSQIRVRGSMCKNALVLYNFFFY